MGGSVWRGRAEAQTPTYEELRTSRVLEREDLAQDPEPAGKEISFIRIVRDDVFSEDELIPTFFNVFHRKTRRSVVVRELLFEEGQPYNPERIEETMRNLRELAVFSLVRIVAVRARGVGRVGVLVYTRDLWSLRLEGNYSVTGSNLDFLSAQLSERNLAGLQKIGLVRFNLVPDTFRLGAVYADRRVANGRFSVIPAVDLIFNRENSQLEGGIGALSLRYPFYDLSQRFAVHLDATASTRIARTLRNGVADVYDVPETADEEAIPLIWDERRASAALTGWYRTGERYRATFGAGFAYEELDVAPNGETGLTSGQREPFARDVLPRERRQLGPALSYALMVPSFATFENLVTFGQSENVQTGPRVILGVWFPLPVFGSSTSSFVPHGKVGYVLGGADALLEGLVSATARLEDGRVTDQRLRVELRGATPVVSFFRLVGRLVHDVRSRDTSREQVSLGGHNGLRGYVSQAFSVLGGSLIRGSLEVRTVPLVLLSVHVGAVLFYDVGTVYGESEAISLHHAAGLGLRVLFPQFNRFVFRADAGVPTGDAFAIVPSFGGSQAVPLTAQEDELLVQ